MPMKIFYGIKNNMIDVTDICTDKLIYNKIIVIPHGENNRVDYFSDPIVGVQKSIFILHNDVLTEYNLGVEIRIDFITDKITIYSINNLHLKTSQIQSTLELKHGRFKHELPEQRLSVRYLTGDEKILEIGGNIGRNSLIMSSILKNSSNLVVLESSAEIADKLIENRDLNKFNFHVEKSALSNRTLIQRKWVTIPSTVKHIRVHSAVNSITLAQLNEKYNIEFDTLVLDCEGAFYYIILDIPEILNNIKLIIIENDFPDIAQKQYVDKILIENGFYIEYVESGGFGPRPNNFHEVWKR